MAPFLRPERFSGYSGQGIVLYIIVETSSTNSQVHVPTGAARMMQADGVCRDANCKNRGKTQQEDKKNQKIPPKLNKLSKTFGKIARLATFWSVFAEWEAENVKWARQRKKYFEKTPLFPSRKKKGKENCKNTSFPLIVTRKEKIEKKRSFAIIISEPGLIRFGDEPGKELKNAIFCDHHFRT